MEIAIMNYLTGTINVIKGCPAEWETEDVENYLYDTLGYKESDIYYMCSDCSVTYQEKDYVPGPKARTLFDKWKELKEMHPGTTLIFRKGDFYECYNEDAVDVSKVLGITLTDTHTKGIRRIAGFPNHALYTYLPKLIRAGKRVAIGDQLEDPKLTKTLVKRSISCLL